MTTVLKTDGSVHLARQIDFVGKSGTLYRYSVQDLTRAVPTAGANYLIAATTNNGASVLFVGETENLASRDWQRDLERAQGQSRDSELLIRLNVRGAVRKLECEDMIAAYAPALNVV